MQHAHTLDEETNFDSDPIIHTALGLTRFVLKLALALVHVLHIGLVLAGGCDARGPAHAGEPAHCRRAPAHGQLHDALGTNAMPQLVALLAALWIGRILNAAFPEERGRRIDLHR